MKMISRWTGWTGGHKEYHKFRLDGHPSHVKLTVNKFTGSPWADKTIEMTFTDVEVYEIHSLTARWLYAQHGQECDELLEHHKKRFGDWFEAEHLEHYGEEYAE